MADVLTYDSAYLAKERKRVKDDVSYARYKVGSTWYQADIQSAEILSDGRVEVTFTIARNNSVHNLWKLTFSLSIKPLQSIKSSCVSIVFPFLSLSSIPLYDCKELKRALGCFQCL